jgi:hypothetical protein
MFGIILLAKGWFRSPFMAIFSLVKYKPYSSFCIMPMASVPKRFLLTKGTLGVGANQKHFSFSVGSLKMLGTGGQRLEIPRDSQGVKRPSR